MAALAIVSDLKKYLEIPSGDTSQDERLQLLLDMVEEQLVAACNRTARPFQAAEEGRVEYCAGTRRPRLWLSYPIDAVLSIKVGRDPDTAVSIDPNDMSIVVWRPGDRFITRVDGAEWGDPADPAAVTVTYNTQADLPKRGKLAVIHACTVLYRQSGSEDVTQERLATYSRKLAAAMRGNPIWEHAIETLKWRVIE